MHKGQHRVRYLDGLRGLAILLVLGWHYLGPVYAMHLPYGDAYAGLPLVRQGWAGVNLFFLISGYVIFMTLERCSGFVDFLLRRWLRLFPGMVLATALIYLAAHAMAARMPGGAARPIDLLPGLILVNPIYFDRYFGIVMRSLDGAFWSLYVEAAFYVVIGALFFLVGWARGIAGLILIWIATLMMPPIAHMLHAVPWIAPPYRFLRWAGVGYFGWFASGALFQRAHVTGERHLFACAVAIGLIASLTTAMPDHMDKWMRLALAASVLLFAAADAWRPLQRLLEARWLLFLGLVSYPLYLIHSAIGVGLIAALAAWARLPALVAPLLVTAAMLAMSWVIAAWGEPGLARLLRPLLDGIRARLRVRPSSSVPEPFGAIAS